MAKLNLQDLYLTTTTSTIPSTTSDGSFSVATAPQWQWGFIELNSEDATKKEKFKYYNVSWTSIFYRWVDRSSPKEHSIWSTVAIKDFSFFFNHLNSLSWEQFKIEQIDDLEIKIWGWKVRKENWELITLSDTDLTVSTSNTNYVYIDTSDDTIKITTDLDTALEYWIIWEAVSDSIEILTFENYAIKYVWWKKSVFTTSTTLKKADNGAICSNTTGSASFTLPTATPWLHFQFFVWSANNLSISTSWTIRYWSTNWTTLTCANVGESISLTCNDTGIWTVSSLEWTWDLS